MKVIVVRSQGTDEAKNIPIGIEPKVLCVLHHVLVAQPACQDLSLSLSDFPI